MTDKDYASMSIADLIEIFKQTSLIQYDSYITGDSDNYNRNYEIQDNIVNELKSRGRDARRRLLMLINHENPQVRLQAAERVYPVAREAALKCLQELAAAGLPDQTLAARMTLRRLEEVPDCLDH